jgi:hypothetical protein
VVSQHDAMLLSSITWSTLAILVNTGCDHDVDVFAKVGWARPRSGFRLEQQRYQIELDDNNDKSRDGPP